MVENVILSPGARHNRYAVLVTDSTPYLFRRCYHDRDSSHKQHDYAHGLRYCTGTPMWVSHPVVSMSWWKSALFLAEPPPQALIEIDRLYECVRGLRHMAYWFAVSTRKKVSASTTLQLWSSCRVKLKSENRRLTVTSVLVSHYLPLVLPPLVLTPANTRSSTCCMFPEYVLSWATAVAGSAFRTFPTRTYRIRDGRQA